MSASIVQVLLQLVATGLLARILVPADFGLVGMALAVTGFSQIFAQLGVAPALIQRENLAPEHVASGRTISVALGLACTLILWVAAPPIERMTGMAGLTSVLRVSSFVFPIQGISVVGEALLQRGLEFRWLALLGTVSYAIGYGIVGVLSALAGWGYWSLVAATLAVALSRTVAILWKDTGFAYFGFSAGRSGEILGYGGGISLGNTCGFVAGQADNFIVGQFLGASALGVYGRAYRLMALPANLFGQAIERVVFPSFSAIQSNREKLATAQRRGTAITSVLAMPVSTLTFILAPEIVLILLGNQWGEVVFPLQMLSLAMFFRVALKIGDLVGRATGAVTAITVCKALYAVLVVCFTLWGVQHGLDAAAFGVAVALLISYLAFSVVGIKVTGLPVRQFLSAHFGGIVLAFFVAAIARPTAAILRGHAFPPLVVLVATLGTTSSVLAFVLWASVRRFAKSDLRWWFDSMMTLVKRGTIVNADSQLQAS
jgi:PST family polysaccharide transporter